MAHPPLYDGGRLLELFDRAAIILRNTQQGPERFGLAASVLCEFFQTVVSDDNFWGVLGGVIDGQPDITEILQSLDDFEDDEYQLLVAAGVDERVAADLVRSLRRQLERYRPGSAPATQELRNGIDQMAGAVCSAQNELATIQQGKDGRRRRRAKLRLLGRCLKVAASIVTIVVDIPAVPTLAGIGSIVGGVLEAGQQVAEHLAESETDG
ncbi:hypothetical protein MAAFP003_3412 [Mycobacterium ahvazicum]|uniref:Uncharacterized protein n=1 Tax=Mycobacterium ahvazicum TaxID=1964395 RepID=A0A2K4YD73_9MYCO|nr:hypothetical protein [Mycobacterium ahvazicum]SOX54734.1 hypothetical protein MAAFP003_3412 [Mycobacterium ahvazicum]